MVVLIKRASQTLCCRGSVTTINQDNHGKQHHQRNQHEWHGHHGARRCNRPSHRRAERLLRAVDDHAAPDEGEFVGREFVRAVIKQFLRSKTAAVVGAGIGDRRRQLAREYLFRSAVSGASAPQRRRQPVQFLA
jgi:hypothetical protein